MQHILLPGYFWFFLTTFSLRMKTKKEKRKDEKSRCAQGVCVCVYVCARQWVMDEQHPLPFQQWKCLKHSDPRDSGVSLSHTNTHTHSHTDTHTQRHTHTQACDLWTCHDKCFKATGGMGSKKTVPRGPGSWPREEHCSVFPLFLSLSFFSHSFSIFSLCLSLSFLSLILHNLSILCVVEEMKLALFRRFLKN